MFRLLWSDEFSIQQAEVTEIRKLLRASISIVIQDTSLVDIIKERASFNAG